MICQQCRREFTPKRAQRMCSHACHNDSRRVVDLWTLRTFVDAGISKSRMAREFGVQRKTIRQLIAGHGLERRWRERRYA